MSATTIETQTVWTQQMVLTEAEAERRDNLAGRLLQSLNAGGDLLTIYIGMRLGYYQALAEGGPATSSELAVRTGTHERYTREWLEQQAVAGFLDVAAKSDDPMARRYHIPPGHAEALLAEESLSYAFPIAHAMVALAPRLEELIRAYRSGGGVPYSAYGADLREAQAEFNRPLFVHLLTTEWLPSLPDIHARLQANPAARVADVACGAGWSSIAIAKAYPQVRVDGYDDDEPSIVMARQNARQAGVADRVHFEVRDAAALRVAHMYDLVTVFEAIHDMAQPIEALKRIKDLLAAGGSVFIADEKVPEEFSAPGDDIARFFYLASTLLCLPAGMAEQPSLGTGAVIRPAIMQRYAKEAGFKRSDILPIQHDFFRFYRLYP